MKDKNTVGECRFFFLERTIGQHSRHRTEIKEEEKIIKPNVVMQFGIYFLLSQNVTSSGGHVTQQATT